MNQEFINHLKKYLSDDDIKKLLDSREQKVLNSLLIDETKINVDDFLKSYPLLKTHPFVKNAFIYEKDTYDFGKSLEFELGGFYLLEPCSLMVNYFLKPSRDDLVLDCCASPGGKTIHCSFLMGNVGLIIANELNESRAYTLSSNIEKYGRKNVIVTNNDILDFPSNYENTFTKIILDAPCSGSGMFRKENKMEEDWTYQKVLKLAALQKEIILKAYSLLAPGGKMVYSTCSFSYEEDEEVIKYLLANSDAELIKIEDNKLFYQSDLKGTIHLFPYLFDGEGHFIAIIQKPNTDSLNILKRKKEEKNLTPYNLSGFYSTFNNKVNLLTMNYRITGLKIIREGLFLGEIDKKLGFIPSHALSRLQDDNLPYIELNKEETLSYLMGNTLAKNIKNGYYFLKYNNLPFALTKVTNNILKNHYPKGLRKKII